MTDTPTAAPTPARPPGIKLFICQVAGRSPVPIQAADRESAAAAYRRLFAVADDAEVTITGGGQ